MVEQIIFDDKLYATIIRNNFKEKGIHFFTENNLSQQIAFMSHPAGKVIQPHLHKPLKRIVNNTLEVLVIKKGKIRVDFYSENKEMLDSTVLYAGDVILLISGGHGFHILEDIEMFEIKQGPYEEDMDKVRFIPLKNKS